MGANTGSVLALRMLYSSVCSNIQLSYHSFLTGMDRGLRHSLEPLDVLYFWQHAGAIGVGTTWMAVFAIDEVYMRSIVGLPDALLLANFCISSSVTCDKPACLFAI